MIETKVIIVYDSFFSKPISIVYCLSLSSTHKACWYRLVPTQISKLNINLIICLCTEKTSTCDVTTSGRHRIKVMAEGFIPFNHRHRTKAYRSVTPVENVLKVMHGSSFFHFLKIDKINI